MRRPSSIQSALTLAVLSAVAVAAEAQIPPPRSTGPTVIVGRSPSRSASVWLSRDPQGFFVAQRGRLGILVDLVPDAARDSIGARVAGVTPGGPADRAGVRTDDIVVRLNGTRLATGGAARDDTEDGQSPPGARLIEMAARLHSGDTVQLDLRREDRRLTVTFEADESEMDYAVARLRDRVEGGLPGLRDFALDVLPESRGHVSIRVGGPLASLELVRVNAGLSEYFGTSEGLLVVENPSDSSFALRAGDVILSIGGRRPTSPAHALRILSTYEAGDTVSFEIMRSRRRTTVSGRMPSERQWRVYRNSFELPLPGLEFLPEHLPPLVPRATKLRSERGHSLET